MFIFENVKILTICTNPEELRKLADEMERFYSSDVNGNSMFKEIKTDEGHTEIRIVLS